MSSAVLLIVYNRPDKTRQVLEQIIKAEPKKVYVAADGPVDILDGDDELCRQVRDVVMHALNNQHTDSPNETASFEFKTLFRSENMGCGPSVKHAIDWFFSHEEEGIILEDDTVPDPSFFRFCDELLERYREDERIGFISGSNHFSGSHLSEGTRDSDLDKNPNENPSYFFARNKTTWGWATWKRAWKLMDYTMEWRKQRNAKKIIRNMSLLEESSKYWMNALMSIEEKNVSAWDWQWYFSVAAQNQLVIYPTINLVSNIGFGRDATHTTGRADKEITRRYPIKFPLQHPHSVVADDLWDMAFEEKKLQIRFWLIKKYIPVSLKRFIRRHLRNIRNGV